MKHIKTFKSFLNEASINESTDYAVMLTGGSIGDKPRPSDAREYVGMEVDGAEELMNLQNAKAKAKRMNGNLSPGEKSHYGLKYVVVPVSKGKFIKESFINEFGPLAGSGNADQLEQIKKEAMKKSESGSTVYVVGKNGGYKLSKYYEEKNTYAAYHNGMPTPVDESLVNEAAAYKNKNNIGDYVKFDDEKARVDNVYTAGNGKTMYTIGSSKHGSIDIEAEYVDENN